MSDSQSTKPIASVVIPAHNEERSIERTLRCVLLNALPGELEIIVACNGCTDRTAQVARSFGPAVRVIETQVASKYVAMRLADAEARAFPRIYVDADVDIRTGSIRDLVTAVGDGVVLAAGPRRSILLDGASVLVRSYYRVWQRLPQIQRGLYGRGVIALSRAGVDRIIEIPPMLSDDLVVSDTFHPDERLVVPTATVVIRPPLTIHDLIRRRVRVVTGNTQADHAGLRSRASQTSVRTLASMTRHEPQLFFHLPVFLGATFLARLLARKAIRANDFTTWQRDESSR